MPETKNIARVVLRSDGSVHIVFRDFRSIYATAANLLEFFSSPVEFIETGSHAYKDSTQETNRKRVALDEVPGLTLAIVNSDKQIVCDFPELFQYVSEKAFNDEEKHKKLNMQDFENRNIFPDEKSFLLRYYFDFAKSLHTTMRINKQIKLREEVQFAIVREILNTHFLEELPKESPATELSSQIAQSESKALFSKKPSDEENYITVNEYALLNNVTPQTVRKYVNSGRLKDVRKTSRGAFLLNKNERPIEWERRGRRKSKKPPEEKRYVCNKNSSAADILESIRRHNYFTDAIAPYIRTSVELEYYIKKNYHEVCWNGRPALIVDVNPDYIVPDHMVPQKVKSKHKGNPEKIFRNRDLMEEGGAPVVPEKNKDEYLFHVHHVGCRKTSPFCIMPAFDHNSKDLSAALHQGTSDPDLHGPEFDVHKKLFWKEYLRAYDEAGKFSDIPYLNPRRKQKNNN